MLINKNFLQNISNNEFKKYNQLVWESSGESLLKYCFRKPNKVQSNKKYPLLLFLHGAGGRGSNNTDQLIDAGSLDAFQNQLIFSKHESYLLAPQVAEEKKWVNIPWETLEHKMPKISNSMAMTFEVLDNILKDSNYQIDINRIYIMGISMGGYGVWDAIQRKPKLFAAGVPICGGGDVSKSNLINHLPIWAWHGDRDEVINVKRTTSMVKALKSAGNDIKCSIVENRKHDVWIDVWNSKDLWNWLYSQSL